MLTRNVSLVADGLIENVKRMINVYIVTAALTTHELVSILVLTNQGLVPV